MSDAEAPPNVVARRAMTPEIPGTLRAVALGSLIGVVLAFAGVAGALLVSGKGTATALGIGAMAAFWGGLGFGSMLGGTLHLVRATEGPRRATETAPSADRAAPSPTPSLGRAWSGERTHTA
jgi:hypothetical protein